MLCGHLPCVFPSSYGVAYYYSYWCIWPLCFSTISLCCPSWALRCTCTYSKSEGPSIRALHGHSGAPAQSLSTSQGSFAVWKSLHLCPLLALTSTCTYTECADLPRFFWCPSISCSFPRCGVHAGWATPRLAGRRRCVRSRGAWQRCLLTLVGGWLLGADGGCVGSCVWGVGGWLLGASQVARPSNCSSSRRCSPGKEYHLDCTHTHTHACVCVCVHAQCVHVCT